MKRSLFSLPAVVIFFLISVSPLPAQVRVKILATVNGEAITQTDVDEILMPIYSQYANTYAGDTLAQKLATARADILTQLIEDKLIMQEAKKKQDEFPVEDKEIDRMVNEVRAKFKTEAEFNAVLAEEHLTPLDLRKRYHEQLLAKKLVEKEVISRIVITPAEISAYYAAQKEAFREPEEARLRNIFLASAKDEEALLAKIRDVYAQIHKGVPFAELVERYSEDQNVVNAGDMGVMKKGTMRPEIDTVVFSTPAGQVAPPVKTPNGYYIFKVEERRDSYIPTLEQVQQVIHKRLFDEKLRVSMDEWVNKLKQQAFIEVKDHETQEKS